MKPYEYHLANSIIARPLRQRVLANILAVVLVVALMMLAVWAGGCAARVKTVTNLPPGVTQQQAQDWDAAVADLHKIADVTTTLRQAVITLRGSGQFPNDKAYADFIVTLAKMDQGQIQAAEFLKATPQTFGASQKATLKVYIQQITQELATLNAAGATGIKDANSLQQVNKLLTEFSTAALLVLNLTQ